jgi:hypothetical protein
MSSVKDKRRNRFMIFFNDILHWTYLKYEWKLCISIFDFWKCCCCWIRGNRIVVKFVLLEQSIVIECTLFSTLETYWREDALFLFKKNYLNFEKISYLKMDLDYLKYSSIYIFTTVTTAEIFINCLRCQVINVSVSAQKHVIVWESEFLDLKSSIISFGITMDAIV